MNRIYRMVEKFQTGSATVPVAQMKVAEEAKFNMMKRSVVAASM